MNANARPLNKDEIRSARPSRVEINSLPRKPISIILDNLKCAHNVGTILRTADAVLADHVYLTGSTITPPNGKLKSASRGAEKWMPWTYSESAVNVIYNLKTKGYFVVACEITKSSIDYRALSIPNAPLAIVLGREYDGVSPDTLEICDAVVHFPMYGMANSLNVGVSAGIILYHMISKFE